MTVYDPNEPVQEDIINYIDDSTRWRLDMKENPYVPPNYYPNFTDPIPNKIVYVNQHLEFRTGTPSEDKVDVTVEY